MEFFYDGQIRRYVTQFMRIFIGFKWQAGDGDYRSIPVMYGDMTRQVAAIIKENSENKLLNVPKIACYITGIELDKTRLADPTFVSKINIHERDYIRPNEPGYVAGSKNYRQTAGNAYTVERIMPTPFVLKMKADIWTSNTDQKLQIFEQIAVLFNPSIELQTTDNYVDWTSLTVVDLESSNFSSRSIPAGADTEIDICSLEFKMPIYISPPAKVKRMGVIRDVIMNVFDATGDIGNLNSLVFNGTNKMFRIDTTPGQFGVLLLSANLPGPENANIYHVSVLNPSEAVSRLKLEAPVKRGEKVDWNLILAQYSGRHIDGLSMIHFSQLNGYEINGTFSINPLDPTILVATLDMDSVPNGGESGINVDAIINPLTFNPRPDLNVLPVTGTSYLLLEDIGGGTSKKFIATSSSTIIDTGVEYSKVNAPDQGPKQFEVFINGVSVQASVVPSSDPKSSFRILLQERYNVNDLIEYRVYVNEDGADAWAEYEPGVAASEQTKLSELIARANDIVRFNGQRWEVVFDSVNEADVRYMTNIKTGIQYKWDGEQWLRSFEGEYRSGTWRFTLN